MTPLFVISDQQFRRPRREIGHDPAGTGAFERHQAFQHDAFAIDPAICGGRFDHRVFAGDLKGEGGDAKSL